MNSRRVGFHLIWAFTMIAALALPLQAVALSIGEERKIGDQLMYSVRKELTILDDPDISQYIDRLGREVLERIGPQYFTYRFFVVKSNQFNAFAAPAGLVFFYSGLIETMANEDELTSVLAHEIGHVVSRHIAQRMEKGGKVNAASMIFGLVSLALGVPALSQGLLAGSVAAGQAINLQYSREDEEQADRLSFGWMQEMERNPQAMEAMLKIMRRITRYRSGELPQYLLTHPNPEARLNYVQSLLEQDDRQKKANSYRSTDNFDFLRFKYRVMMQSVEQDKLRQYCLNLASTSKDLEQLAMAQFGLALLEKEERNYDKAFAHLKAVRQKYPDRDILELDRASIFLAAGRTEEALSLLEKAYQRDPTDMYGVYQLAKVELQRGNTARAEKLLQEVAKVMPEYPQLFFDMGRVKANQGKDNISLFYLGKYNLYLGKVKIAKQYLIRTARDRTVPDNYREEANKLLDDLKEIERGFN